MKRDGNGKYTWAFLGQYPDPDPNLWVFDDFEMLFKDCGDLIYRLKDM